MGRMVLPLIVLAALAIGGAAWLLRPTPQAPRSPSGAAVAGGAPEGDGRPTSPPARSTLESVPYRAPEPGPGEAAAAPETVIDSAAEGGAPPPKEETGHAISVIVRHAAGPVPKGSARLLRVEDGAFPEGLDWSGNAKARMEPLSSDGHATFRAVPEGVYLVGLDLGEGIVRESEVHVDPGRGTRRVPFAFGGSSLEGRVYSVKGPAEGARVQLAFRGRAGQPVTAVWTTAAPDGRYRFDALPAGRCVLAASLASSRWTGEARATRALELEDGDPRTEDLELR